ncbi:MAG: SH3 domain-containing protein [Lachnospiraceae bacterium]|nr:SH3 domain-containing protein [Candidatus Minthocola equi]
MTTSTNGWDDLDQEFGDIDDLTGSSDGFEDIDIIEKPVNKTPEPIIPPQHTAPRQEYVREDAPRPVRRVETPITASRGDTHTRTYNPEEIRKMAAKDEPEEKHSARYSQKPEKKSSNTGLITGVIIGVVVLLLAGIVFLVAALLNKDDPNPTDPSGNPISTSEEATTAAWDVGTDKINELAENYYKSRALVDVFTLTQLLDPSVQIDEDQLKGEASVVDEYTDISTFIADGMKDGEWVAYFFYSLKIKNINTPVPGLEPVYIVTDETGNLRIKTIDVVMADDELNLFFANVANCDAVNELVEGADAAYRLAISQDQQLFEFIKSIGGNVEPVDPATDPSSTDPTAPTTEAPTTEAPTTEAQPTTPASSTDFITCDTCMYITKNDVNMRKQPNTNAEVVKTLKLGTYVQVMAKSTDWYKICDFNNGGAVGYVSSQFFSDEKPSNN